VLPHSTAGNVFSINILNWGEIGYVVQGCVENETVKDREPNSPHYNDDHGQNLPCGLKAEMKREIDPLNLAIPKT